MMIMKKKTSAATR